MPSKPTVATPTLPATDPDGYAWDWSATTHTGSETAGKRRILSAGGLAGADTMSPSGLVDDLLAGLGAETVTIGKGLQGWPSSLHAFDAGGYKTGAVYFGGGRDDVHVVSSSMQADDARRAVIGIGDARTARVDTKVDTLVPFDELQQMCMELGGRGTQVALWESRTLRGDGESDPGGRTIYVGAPSSAVRIRIYEKWLESPGLYVDGANRVEVQLRPPSRAKGLVSGWAPAETFCASKLTRRLAERLREAHALDVAHPPTLQKSKGTPDLQRSLEAMGEQYGGIFRKWMHHSGGDLGTVIGHLAHEVDET